MATIQIRELSEEAYETIRRRARAGDARLNRSSALPCSIELA